MSTVMDGVIIGGAGGAIAGLTVYAVQYIHNKVRDRIDSKRVYQWLLENIPDNSDHNYRATHSIANLNNLTQDRVRYLCSTHEDIYLFVGNKDERWGVKSKGMEGW